MVVGGWWSSSPPTRPRRGRRDDDANQDIEAAVIMTMMVARWKSATVVNGENDRVVQTETRHESSARGSTTRRL
jgi:hypothetical protein